MLEYIHLKNFQKYKDYTRTFNDRVNFITGVNGSGKSTILRAIMWVARNVGDSKSMLRTYEDNGDICTSKEVSAEIGIDGHTVKRVYSSSKNEYYVDGLKITGFGKSVPEEVASLFKMSDLNYSEQFSPLFLLSDSGNSLATELGEVASLEEMDELADSINANIRTKQAEIQTLEQSVNEADKKLSNSFSDELYEMDKELQNMITEYRDKEKEIDELETIHDNLESRKDLTYLKDAIDSVEPDVCLFNEDVHLVELMGILTKLKTIPPISQDLVDNLDCDLKDTDFEVEDVSFLENIINSVKNLESDSGFLTNELADIEQKLSSFSVCPYCGNSLGEHKCQS